MSNNENSIAQKVADKSYISFTAESMEDKIKLYNAINSAKYKISDMINKVINIRDVVLKEVMLVDEKTGEATPQMRSIIIDDKGDTYAATSSGVYSSLTNILTVFGTLHFEDGLKVTVEQKATKRGSTLNLAIVSK